MQAVSSTDTQDAPLIRREVDPAVKLRKIQVRRPCRQHIEIRLCVCALKEASAVSPACTAAQLLCRAEPRRLGVW